ncbi:MAG: BspA family leucine-rich repeat surface protein, partial [Erysipelotrichaceae bacterium]|nr:BspA family leucine-rich repeat surface protein [Erysipelotrichaceae bacterium]
MFAECSSLKDLDLHSFDTSKVINMSEMFAECSSLKDLDLHNFNTGSVYNVSNMFAYCSSLQSLDLSGFDTSEIWNRQGKGMLYGCDSLKKINLSDSFFKGDMSGCNPIYQNANWVQTDNHHNFKSWLEMPETWNKEDAGWWRLADDSYVLTFESNGGTEYAHCCEADGTSIDISEYIPYKPWNTFTGWYLDPECTQKVSDDLFFTTDTTLYADWKIQDRTLSFETNSRFIVHPVTVKYGSTLNLECFKLANINGQFTGWYTDPDCTIKAENILHLTSDTTLYAGWNQ